MLNVPEKEVAFRLMSESCDNRAGITGDTIPADWLGFCAFIESHYRVIYTVALAHVRDGDVAQEITQDVCVRLLLEREKLPPLTNAAGWLARVSRNTAIDWVRRRQTHSRILAMMESWKDDPTAGNHVPADARKVAIKEEEKQRLLAALNQIAPEDREMLLLHFVDGLEKQEIAQVLEIHPSTVGRRVDKALTQLRKLMAGFEPLALQSLRKPEHTSKSLIMVLGSVMALTAGEKAALAAVAAPLPVLSAGTAVSTGAGAGSGGVLRKVIKGGGQLSQHGQTILIGVATVALLVGVYSFTQSSKERAAEKQESILSSSSKSAELQKLSARVGRASTQRRNGNSFNQNGLNSDNVQVLGYLPVVTSQTTTLRGKVVGKDDKPVAGAAVTAWGTSTTSKTVISQADGSFNFLLPKEGTATITASAEGFAPTAWGEYVALLPMPMLDDPFTLVLDNPVQMTGRVVDEQGNPLGGAKLSVVRIFDRQRQVYNGRADYLKHGSYWNGGLEPGTAVADAHGRFELQGLRPGFVSVYIQHPTVPGIIVEELQADDDDVVIALGKGVAVEGRVLDGEKPLAGLAVKIKGTFEPATTIENPGGSAVTDSNGHFVVENLHMLRSDYAVVPFVASVESSSPVRVPDYFFTVQKWESTCTLEMNTVDQGKEDPGSDWVDVTKFYGARTQPEQFGGAQLEGTVALPAEVSDGAVVFLSSENLNDEQPVMNGRFVFEKLPAGEYLAKLRLKDQVKSLQPYQMVYVPQRVEVRDGHLHTISINPGPCSVKGKVSNGLGPAAEGSISISTADAASAHYNSLFRDGFIASQTLDSSGDFEFRGLMPGSYYLVFGDSGSKRVEEIECRAGKVTRCELKAEPLLLIHGEIRTADGKPASGVRIALDRATGGAGIPKRAVNEETDARGKFSEHVSTGTYTLLVQPRDRLFPDTYTVEVREGKTTLPVITLNQQVSSGIVIKPSGIGPELWRTAQYDLIPRTVGEAASGPRRVYPTALTGNSAMLSGIIPGEYTLIVRSSKLDDWPQHLKPGDAVPFSTVVVPQVHVSDDAFSVISVSLEPGRLVTVKCLPGNQQIGWVAPQFWIKDSDGGVIPLELPFNFSQQLGLAPGKYRFGVTLDSGEEQSVGFEVMPADKHTEVELRLH